MFEFLNDFALYTPLAAIVVAIIVFNRRRGKVNEAKYRSSGLFIFGFLTVGALFFIIGFIVGAEIYCKNSEYAECALGGIFVGGPISFTIAVLVYLCLWGMKGKRP